MSKVCEFLQECGAFFVLTVNGDSPAGRPFGAVTEDRGALYLSTTDQKSVYAQLRANPNVQIVAWKAGTRDWIRIDGRAEECADVSVKAWMLEACPNLKKRFPTADSAHFVVLRVEPSQAYLYTERGEEKLN